jgi:hypothetical protein
MTYRIRLAQYAISVVAVTISLFTPGHHVTLLFVGSQTERLVRSAECLGESCCTAYAVLVQVQSIYIQYALHPMGLHNHEGKMQKEAPGRFLRS